MKVCLEFELNDCRGCILRKQSCGHGEGWDYCTHPEAPSGYNNVIDDFLDDMKKYGFPVWCPFKKD